MLRPEALDAAVGADSFLTLHYRLSRAGAQSADDDFVNTFGSRPATLQLGAGQLSPTLEELLHGLPVGTRRVFEVEAGTAFGPRNPALVQRLPRTVLEEESDWTDGVATYSPGDVVEFNAPGGGRYAGVFRSLDNDYATFDFNHPLAGQPVRFEVEIVGIL